MLSRGQNWFLLGGFVIIALLPLLGSRYILELTIQIMIYGLFAMSLNVLSGQIGSISFGHAGFLAIGGYACAYLLTTAEWPFAAAMAGSVLFTAVSALVIGYFCVRLNDIYFAILTMSFAMLIWAVAFKWKSVTGGADGFVGVRVPNFLANPVSFFWYTFAVFSVSIGLMWVLSNSTMGKTFIAVRENPLRASFLGVDVIRMRLIAFVIAGTFAGVAGSLLTLYVRGMFPESAFWSQSGHALIMVLLGGIRFFVGPLVGAATLYALEVFSGQYTVYWGLVMGLVLLVIVTIAPEGLVGIIRKIGFSVLQGRAKDA